MGKKKSIILCGFLVLAFSFVGYEAVGTVFASGQAANKGLTATIQIGAEVSVGSNWIDGIVSIKGPGKQSIADALVMLNDTRLNYMNTYPYYQAQINQNVGIGTQVTLRIWLNDPQSSLPLKGVPARPPDYSGSGTVTNWLTPVFPAQGGSVDLSAHPAPTFMWAFAGAMENTCLLIESQAPQAVVYRKCGVQVAQIIPAGTLLPGRHYHLNYENFFPFAFAAAKGSPAFTGSFGFIQKTEVGFDTI